MSQQLVIFDWDGTIMDSVYRIVESMQAAAHRAKLNVPTEQAVKDIIGLSLAPALVQLFGQLSSDTIALLTQYYRDEYVDAKHSDTPLFDGIEEVLKTLREQGYLLAIATGKSRVGLDRLLSESGLAHYFSDSMTADEAQSKPHPEMIDTLVNRLGVLHENTVMIGDSVLDMTMAGNANVRAVGVSYGAHTPQVLARANPMAIVAHPLDLLPHLAP